MTERFKHSPTYANALALWAGSDHYSIIQALSRQEFSLPENQEAQAIYHLKMPALIERFFEDRFVVAYTSESRECLAVLPGSETFHFSRSLNEITLPHFLSMLLSHLRKEPTIFLLPLVFPAVFLITVILFNLWNSAVLHNNEFLSIFVQPGCDMNCARKVLSVHSLVALLFLIQSIMVFLPLGLLLFQAPRYRSALNYRMIQSFSMTSVIFGAVIFAQLMVIFPFRQYSKFTGLGFTPKVERAFLNLKSK